MNDNITQKTGRRATLVLALIFCLLSLVYLIYEYHQVANKIYKKTEISDATPFFRLLLETGQKKDSDKPPDGTEKSEPATKEIEHLVVQSIQLTPDEPTVLDSIKAEAKTNYDNKGMTYEHRWLVNQKAIEDVKGDTLLAGNFKKYDHISVIVTPLREGLKGYPYVSRTLIIHNSVPSLDMKILKERQKIGEPVELQLTSTDPDGDKVAFSLEEPALEGMTIDKETGKIVWTPKTKEKRTYLFSASAADPEGAKITKTFEIKID